MNLQYGQFPYQVDQIPQGFCDTPTDLLAEVNGDIVTLSWKTAHAVLYFQVVITNTADGTIAYQGNISGLRFTTQLDPNSQYTATVTAICATDPERTSDASATVDFATGDHIKICLAVDINTVLFTLLPDSVILAWPAPDEAIAYNVYYRIKNSTLGYDKITVQLPVVTLSGLVYNTPYEYYITTLCNSGIQADSELGTFTPPLDPAECPPPVINIVQNGLSAVAVWVFSTLHTSYDIYINGALYLANYSANFLNLSNLAPNTTYTIAVVGKCSGGSSVAGSKSFTTGDGACPTPVNLGLTIADTTATITWDIVDGVDGYEVLVNGTVNPVNTNSYSFAILPGTAYSIQVTSICGTNKSQPASLQFTTPDGCSPIPDAVIASVAGPLSIALDWPDIPSAQYYRWRWKLSADTVWSAYTKITVSKLLLENLTPDTSYDFEIETNCNVGTATVVKTLSTTGYLEGIKPIITSFSNITDSSFCVNFTAGTKLKGTFVLKVRDTNTDEVTEYNGTTLKICVAGKSAHTVYECTVEDRAPGYTIIPSDPSNVTTCYTCEPVTELQALFLDNGDIAISWTQVSDAFQYNVYSRQGTGDWKLEAPVNNSESSYTIADNNFVFKEIKVETVYNDCNSVCSISCFVTCPVVTGLVSDINGTSGTLSWKPLPGIYGYKVLILSLTQTPIESFVTNAFASVDNLAADTTYSWTIVAYCSQADSGNSSDAATFTTGAPSSDDSTCADPLFTALMQDSSLTDGTPSTTAQLVGWEQYKSPADGTIGFTDIRLIGMTKVAVWRGDPLDVVYEMPLGGLLANQVYVNLTTGAVLFGVALDNKEFIYYQWFSA